MNIETVHGPSDNMQGWMRLVVSTLTLAAGFLVGFGSLKANLEAQVAATHDLSTQVLKLNDAVNQLAINTEGLKHDVADMKQNVGEVKTRVDRIETERSGRRP